MRLSGYYDHVLVSLYQKNVARTRRLHRQYAAKQAGVTREVFDRVIAQYHKQLVAELAIRGTIRIPYLCRVDVIEEESRPFRVVVSGKIGTPAAKRGVIQANRRLVLRVRPLWRAMSGLLRAVDGAGVLLVPKRR